MSRDSLDFSGIVFFSGYELWPRDVPLGLDYIRRWAFDAGLIWDPEAQLLGAERLQELQKYISSDDRPDIAISLDEEETGISYMEYPFLPVTTLIRRKEEIRIVYWVMTPAAKDRRGRIVGEVKFGFWLSGCADEFCSLSTATLVVDKFGTLLYELSGKIPVKTLKDGSKEITVDGAVRATFRRDGRQFDVDLSAVR